MYIYLVKNFHIALYFPVQGRPIANVIVTPHAALQIFYVSLHRLTYGGEVAERDIVQFVPFRDFKQV